MNNLDLFTNKKFLEYEEKGGSILLSLHKLFRKACSHGRISSTEFKEAFVTFDSFSDFDNDLQHDAHEFMTLIMDKISEVLRDNNDESDTVSQWFRRAEVSEVLCPTCGSEVSAKRGVCKRFIQRRTADNALKNFTDEFSLKFSQTFFFLPRQKQKHSPHIQMKLGSRPTEILLCARFNA